MGFVVKRVTSGRMNVTDSGLCHYVPADFGYGISFAP